MGWALMVFVTSVCQACRLWDQAGMKVSTLRGLRSVSKEMKMMCTFAVYIISHVNSTILFTYVFSLRHPPSPAGCIPLSAVLPTAPGYLARV